jgi:hypothetical protein
LYFNVGVWKGKQPPPPPPPPIFQGTNFGYASGGMGPLGGSSATDAIEKFPFASDANATDVGDLTEGRYHSAGQSSSVSGYTSGGVIAFTPVKPPVVNPIEKFPFATDANATDVGDLTVTRRGAAGQSSTENGYTSGGGPSETNVIDKFPFATDTNASDVGDLTVARDEAAGQSSTTFGYVSGGDPAVIVGDNTIDKFPFASDANATDVGNLNTSTWTTTGQSSDVSGYTSGGRAAQPGSAVWLNVIQKFPFASDTNASDVGDLTVTRGSVPGGQSSTLSGYTSGGYGSTYRNTIDKFPFASDANATDVGDLTGTRSRIAGQQY